MSGSHTGLCPARQPRSPSHRPSPLFVRCVWLLSFSHCTKWSNNLPSHPSSLTGHQVLYHYDTLEFLSG